MPGLGFGGSDGVVIVVIFGIEVNVRFCWRSVSRRLFGSSRHGRHSWSWMRGGGERRVGGGCRGKCQRETGSICSDDGKRKEKYDRMLLMSVLRT